MTMVRLALFLLGSLCLLTGSARADEPRTDAQSRIALQIGQLVIRIETQQDQIAALQGELAKAQARVKELEAKPKD